MTNDLVMLAIILSGIIGGAFGLTYYACDYDKDKNRAIIFSFLFLMLVTWYTFAATRPKEISGQMICNIKQVEFPDGTKTQMFTFQNKHYSVTEMFHKIVDENKWQVKCIRYETNYFGIKWELKDTFELEQK